ncbi:MAG: M48 family metallopeptidase [Bacteroidota bacterium]|nr:MAG: M48 family metallopeptidase [Bacteroidota bacterium]
MQTDRKIVFDFGEVLFRQSPRSRNLRIRVHPAKGVQVSVPGKCTEERAINFVIEKEQWIRSSLKRMAHTRQSLTLFTPETVFSTHSHTLVLRTHERQFLRMEASGPWLVVYYPAGVEVTHPRVQEFIRSAILKTLRFEAQQYLPAHTRALAKQHGFSVNEVKVRLNTSRWGSCSGTNNISLNIHLMRLPQALIDYVVLHELAHTREKNHGPGFWNLLEKTLPGARRLDKQLNKYHLLYW